MNNIYDWENDVYGEGDNDDSMDNSRITGGPAGGGALTSNQKNFLRSIHSEADAYLQRLKEEEAAIRTRIKLAKAEETGRDAY